MLSTQLNLLTYYLLTQLTQRYSKHVKCRLERFKRPEAVK